MGECFEDIIEGNRDPEQVPPEKVQEYKDKYNDEKYQKGIEFITFFEDNFTCSGVCSKALFYYTLPMDVGPPTATCLLYAKDMIASNLTYMGIASTLCGIILICVWFCQYLLWKKYDKWETCDNTLHRRSS